MRGRSVSQQKETELLFNFLPMITDEKLKEIEKNVPIYEFVETEEELVVKKPIAKIRETAETFTLYDVMKYLEKMTKGIADKEAELE